MKSMFKTNLARENLTCELVPAIRACTTPSAVSSLCFNLAEFAIRLYNWIPLLAPSGLKAVTLTGCIAAPGVPS